MKEEYDDYDDYISVRPLDKWLDNYRCKKCGNLGKVNYVTNTSLNLICESCKRDEKINSILGSF